MPRYAVFGVLFALVLCPFVLGLAPTRVWADGPVDPVAFCADVTEIPCAECEALVALYNSTDGPNWAGLYQNWLQTTTPSDWEGVTVEGGHVVELFLWNAGLKGELPSAMASLKELCFLLLSDNQLSGSIPIWLSSLPHLEELYLDRNQFNAWCEMHRS